MIGRPAARRLAAAFLIGFCVLVSGGSASGGEYGFEYHESSDFLPSTPGVSAGAPGGFFNPAAWSAASGEFAYWRDDRFGREDKFDTWGFSFASPLGFAMEKRVFGAGPDRLTLKTYQLGLSGGDRRFHAGAAWRWHKGDARALEADEGLVVGGLYRPFRHLSVGASGFFAHDERATESIVDVGVRPLGTPLLTLFGDYAVDERQDWGDGDWGAGVEVRPYRGIHLNFKVREGAGDEDVRYHLGLGLTFDRGGFHAFDRENEDFESQSTAALVRFNPPYAGLPVDRWSRQISSQRTVVALSLEKKVLNYRRDRWFDETNVAWLDLSRALEEIEAEPTVSGVALNLSSFRGRPSLLWEFRSRLAAMRAAGKRVYVYADRLDMNGYYLASVADEIVLDPQGELMLPGLALHRTYMRGALGKLGLAAEEWRYFSHKTAFQSFAREDMSEADKEQLGRLVDVVYETWRDGVCAGRGMTPAEFDAVVDEDVMVVASVAVERNLVDGTGRWNDLVERLGRVKKQTVGSLPEYAERRVLPDERWGRPKTIAVVYALGECAMDSGINGRATGKYMRDLAKNRDVAAVVLRADSPGGDPLPSDLVAEGTRKLKEAGKPVVVSQGDVAASGGYWISMDGSKVLTTPLTITGSIGVIAGWVWDDGFSEKYGLKADGVQRGKSADLFTGIRLPLVGATVPERGVTDEEREKVKRLILSAYTDFVRMVAEGRGLAEERVREIGEGRIWMGGDAMERGLTDDWGGLSDAVREAKAMAGIDADDEVIVTEYPPRKLFTLPRLMPELPGIRALAKRVALRGAESPSVELPMPYEWRYLERMIASPGRPLFMVSPDDLPAGWGELPGTE